MEGLSQEEVDQLIAGGRPQAGDRLTLNQLREIIAEEIASASTDFDSARVRRSCWREFDRLVSKLERKTP